MSSDSIDIELVSVESAFLVPYEVAPSKPVKKKDLGKKLENLFLRKKSPPIPEHVEKLAVFGSRSLFGVRVLELIDCHVQQFNPSLIVTAAEPAGVCKTAQEYAKRHSIPLQVHFLNIKKYARGAHEHRSDHVIQASDLVLLIHDGKSQGTYNEVLRTIKFHKPFIYKSLEASPDRALLCEI